MKRFVSALAAVLLTVSFLPTAVYAAGTAAFSLSPATASETIGTTFAVTIYENGSNVNVVTANLSYDPAALQFVSIDAGSSAFGGDASSAGGSGSVSISRYVTPAGATVSGSQDVATVNFKALGGSGSTNVSMASGSHIASSGVDQWDGVATTATYALTTPAVTPPAPMPAPTPTPTPKPTPAPNTQKSITTTVQPTGTTPPAATAPAPAGEVKGVATSKQPTSVTIASTAAKQQTGPRYAVLSGGLLLLALLLTVSLWFMRRQAAPIAATQTVTAGKQAMTRTAKKK